MLTTRQSQILEFIRSYKSETGYPPSVREIGERFGLAPATVHDHLKALDRKGYIAKKPHRSRSLSLIENKAILDQPGKVPVLGQVAAGLPLLAEQNIEDVLQLPSNWTKPGSFLLKVKGESMEGAHIVDGDYVLVSPQSTANNGEIVVALIGDEATVKRFYKKGDQIELRPENSGYTTIKIQSSKGDSVRLIGKVVGVFRI